MDQTPEAVPADDAAPDPSDELASAEGLSAISEVAAELGLVDPSAVDADAGQVDAPDPVANAGAEAAGFSATPAEAPAAARPRPKSPSRGRRPRAGAGARMKEAFWVRVGLPDGTTSFFPATEHIGKIMPFTQPKETCAMRVYPEVVCFSLLHLTKRAAKDLREKPITIPHPSLSRLSRRSAELATPTGTLIVEHRTEVDGEPVDRSVVMTMTVDGAKVVSLESEDPAADELFELGGRGERVSLFLSSPNVARRVALGYIGHLGRPGSNETLHRAAAKIINASAALPEFALLTGIEAADVPGLPGGMAAVRPVTTAAGIDIPVQLFSGDEQPAPVAGGAMRLTLDLEHANASTDRLLFTLTPDLNLLDHFEAYREVAERWMGARLAELLGEDLRSVVFDIVLGEVTSETVVRINEKLLGVGAVAFTPTLFRAIDPSDVTGAR